MISLATIVLISYLLGSVSSSILVARMRGGIDIRRHGSGNPGSTNVVRVLGWAPGLLVLAGDLGKGFLAAWLVSRLRVDAVAWNSESVGLLAGFSVILGHIWPVYTRFRGGKGVATAAGVLLAVHPSAFLACAAVFATLVLVFRLVSVASMGAVVFLPLALIVQRYATPWPVSKVLLVFSVLVAAVVLLAHRSNLARLIAGTEKTIGKLPK